MSSKENSGGVTGGRVWGQKNNSSVLTSGNFLEMVALIGVVSCILSFILGSSFFFVEESKIFTLVFIVHLSFAIATVISLWTISKQSKTPRGLYFASMAIFIVAISCSCWGSYQAASEQASGYNDRMESKNVVLKEEYGYQRGYDIDEDKSEATVTTIDGEEKTVGFIPYKGYNVFFENNEQLVEKKNEIDNGTYPEELKKR